MKAKSINGTSPDQLRSALRDSMSDGFQPSLAIVFLSVKQDRDAVRGVFREAGVDVIGATSSGEFTDGCESHGGIVSLLLDLDRNNYRIILKEIGESTLRETAYALMQDASKAFSSPAFILLSSYHNTSGEIIDGLSLIRYLQEDAGADLNLFGGMAGDDITFQGTFVFTHDLDTDYGVSALVLDESKVSLRGMAISGWKPIGISRTITRSEGNLIYTIDDKPAFELYLRFLGVDPATVKDRIGFFNEEGFHYPIQIEREGRAPMMCNPIGFDEDKSALICESEIEEGSKFRFSTPPDFDIIETVLNKAEQLKEETRSGGEALLIFSCAGRLSAFGPLAEQENEGLHEVWDAPMAGFYTYGEFGKAPDGKHDFHSTTNSWVVLKEI